jgi:hypothetical protein
MPSVQRKNIKISKKEVSIYLKGKLIRATSHLSAASLKVREAWIELFFKLRINDCQPRLQYPAKLPFKVNGEIKNFPR